MIDLKAQSRALILVKSLHYLEGFLRALPGELEFLPMGRQGEVTLGWIQPRRCAWRPLLARRNAGQFLLKSNF